MYFLDPERRESKEVLPGVRIKTFWQDRMLISLVDLDARAVVPDHSHPEEQCGVMLAGEMELEIAGETRVLKPGDAYHIPGNVRHRARAAASGARVMDVFSPVRESYKY